MFFFNAFTGFLWELQAIYKFISMILFDSHCHLQNERCIGTIDVIMDRAGSAGVRHVLCCGTAEQDWESVRLLAMNHRGIIPAFGLHPWFVKERSLSWLEKLEKLLLAVPSATVGEIGLDHALDERIDDDQGVVFVAQLKLARRLSRPVSIHCRKAWGDLLDILTAQCGLPHGGAIHSFSGPADLIPRLVKLNASFSFSGSITFDRNRRGRASALAVPEERLLIETDAPDIPPRGIGDGANEPANCAMVAQTLAELRGCSIEEIGEVTSGNAIKLFVPQQPGV